MGPDLKHLHIAVNGVTLHVVQAGPDQGPLILLLHGFPEYWRGWRHQLPYLAAKGFRVWAPDQRGYNLSSKPAGIASYSLDRLAGDAAGLIEASGCTAAAVAGHDWGAAVAWWTALLHPERITRLAILNVPHPMVMRRFLKRSPRQAARSWYMFLFQMPWLPEALLRLAGWKLARRALLKTSRAGAFGEDDLPGYIDAWSQPGAMRSMIHWYRAIWRIRIPPPASPRVQAPVLLLWGARDRFLGREMAQPSLDLCDQGRLVFLEQATHWLQHEEPEQVNRLLGDFFGSPGTSQADPA